MPEFDKNAAYIWACFALGAALILITTVQVTLAARKARKQLDALEAAGGKDA